MLRRRCSPQTTAAKGRIRLSYHRKSENASGVGFWYVRPNRAKSHELKTRVTVECVVAIGRVTDATLVERVTRHGLIRGVNNAVVVVAAEKIGPTSPHSAVRLQDAGGA